jgi:hypothetical protein
MVLPNRGTNYLKNYYDLQQQSMDSQRKKYRSIPVPVTAVEDSDHIDNRVKLEMLTEYLATRDKFNPSARIDNATFSSMTLDQQVDTIKKLSAEVIAAPSIQKADAQRSLVAQLGMGSIHWGGRFLSGALNSITGAGFLEKAAAPLAWMGWDLPQEKLDGYAGEVVRAAWDAQIVEIAGQALLGVQAFIPGEQTLERNARLRRESFTDREDLSWWRKQVTFDTSQFVTPVIDEHGWGVPAGIHIPLEILFDPTNFLGLGAIRAGKQGIYTLAKASGMADSASVSNFLSRHMPEFADGADTLRAIKYGDYEKLFPEFTRAERKKAERYLRNRTMTAEEADDVVKRLRDERWEATFGYATFMTFGPGRFHRYIGHMPAGGAGDIESAGTRWTDRYGDETLFTQVENKELQPLVRTRPDDEVLFELANNPDLTPQERWSLLAMYHYGLRSDELAYVKFSDLMSQMTKTEGFPEVPMSLGQGKGANNRRMTDEAAKFTRRYLGLETAADGKMIDDPLYGGLVYRSELIGPLPRVSDSPYTAFWIVDPDGKWMMPDATGLNNTLKRSFDRFGYAARESRVSRAEKHAKASEIMSYYPDQNSYVFRLALANRVFSNTMQFEGGRNIRPTMQALGHNSPFHTSRYVASSQLLHGPAKDPEGVYTFFEELKFDPDVMLRHTDKLADEAMAPGGLPNTLGRLFKVYPNTQGQKHADEVGAIDTARLEFLKETMQNTRDVSALIPAGARPESAAAYGLLENLLVFATQIDNMRFEKSLINARDKIQAGVIHENVSDAQRAHSVFKAWMRPVLDLAQEQLRIVGADDAMGGITEILAAPFQQLGIAEMERLLADKKLIAQFKRGGREHLPTLASLLPSFLFEAGSLTKKTRKPTAAAQRLIDEATLSDADLRAKNRANKGKKGWEPPSDELPEGGAYYRRPKADQPKVYHPHLKDAEGNPLEMESVSALADQLETGYVISHKDRTGQKWVVKEWIRAVDPATGERTGAVTDVIAEKLANVWRKKATVVRGTKEFKLDETERLVLAAAPTELRIPLSEMHAWKNDLEVPITAELFVRAGRGGKQKIQAIEIAQKLFANGAPVPGWSRHHDGRGFLSPEQMEGVVTDKALRMRDILKTLKSVSGGERDAWSVSRLQNSGLLVRWGGKRPTKSPYYTWDKRVLDELDRLIDEYPDDFAFIASPADAGKLPPPPPGKGRGFKMADNPGDWSDGIFRNAEDHAPWNALGANGANGGLTYSDIIRNPVGIHTGQEFDKRFSGMLKGMHSLAVKGEQTVANITRKALPFVEHVPGIYQLLNNPHPKMEKVFRMLVSGHTWWSNEWAQSVWRAKTALNRVTQVESTVALVNKQVLDVTGFEPGTSIMKKVKARGVNETPESARLGFNVGTHMEHPANIEMEKLIRQATGTWQAPDLADDMKEVYARMASPWSEADVIASLKKWSYKDNLLDINTFLGTERHRLDYFYEMTPELQKVWDQYHEAHLTLLNVLEDAGIDLVNVFPASFIDNKRINWVPHLRKSHTQTLENAPEGGMSKFGSKPVQFKEQRNEWMITDKLKQAFSSGKIGPMEDLYEKNPVLALSRTVKAYYEYLIMEQFTDEFASFGIHHLRRQDPVDVANQFLKLDDTKKPAILNPEKLRADIIREEGEREIWRLSDDFEAKAAKYYGPDWKKLLATKDGQEALLKRREGYVEQSAAWNNLEIRQVSVGTADRPGYIEAGDPLIDIALPPGASAELAAFGSDMLKPTNKVLSKFSELANISRLLATGSDLGMYLLHGLTSLSMTVSPLGLIPAKWTTKEKFEKIGLSPHAADWASKMMDQLPFTTKTLPWKARTAWGRGVLKGIHALAQPSVRREWYLNTVNERREMAEYGVSFFRSTFLEDIPLPGVFSDQYTDVGAKPTAGVRGAAMDIARRPVEGFGFFLDVAKTEMWRAYKELGFSTVEEGGRDLLHGFAASLNAIHGTLDPNIAGIKNKQRTFESAFLLYAALYRRSSVALLLNCASGNRMRRNQALAGVSGLLSAGAIFGYLMKGLGLNEDVFDWGSPDFMAVKAGRVRIGLGTPFYTMFRMASDLVGQMQNEGDYSGLYSPSFTDNVLLKWFRSQTSPVTGFGIDAFTGRTFVGDPLRDADGGWEVQSTGRRMSSSLMPFWIESMFDSSTPTWSALGEFFGLRVSPRSAWGRLQAGKQLALETSNYPEIVSWRNHQKSRGLPVTVGAAPILLVKRLVARSAELTQLQSDASADSQKRGTTLRKDQDSFINDIKITRNLTDRKLAGVAAQFNAGEITGRDFQEQIRIIEAEMRGTTKALGDRYSTVIENFDSKRTNRIDNPNEYDVFYYDRVYDLYRIQVTNDPQLHDAYGNFNVERFLKLQNRFRLRYGEGAWRYIERRRADGRHTPGAVKELDDARELLSDYWNLHTQIWPEGSWQVELVNNWRTLQTKQAKDLFELKYPQINQLNRIISRRQVTARRQNPAVDAALVRFYDYVPQNPASTVLLQDRRDAALLAVS